MDYARFHYQCRYVPCFIKQGAFYSDDMREGGPFSYKNVFRRQSEVWGSEAVLFSCHPEVTIFSCGEHRLQFVKNRNAAEGILF